MLVTLHVNAFSLYRLLWSTAFIHFLNTCLLNIYHVPGTGESQQGRFNACTVGMYSWFHGRVCVIQRDNAQRNKVITICNKDDERTRSFAAEEVKAQTVAFESHAKYAHPSLVPLFPTRQQFQWYPKLLCSMKTPHFPQVQVFRHIPLNG